jgi:hypothetical protein
VWNAALAKFAAAESAASGKSWSIPEIWVGRGGDWSSAFMVEVIKALRLRYTTQMPRTKADRDALDWNTIKSQAQALTLSRDFGGIDDDSDWMWSRMQLHCAGILGWAVMDMRTIGPADAGGGFANYLATGIDTRDGRFNIDTDDERITAPGDPTTGGTLMKYDPAAGSFRPDRGLYHYSYYVDKRFDDYWQTSGSHTSLDMNNDELAFIEAEARYRTSDKAGAMAIVNTFRARGNLPAFTDANGVAPGGARCVPKPAGTTCGDLWEALKYEKRIELFHLGYGTEYFDDRGWGDLVTDTPLQLPIPGKELLLLLKDIYTFGGPEDPTSAPNLINDFSPEGLAMKRQAIERFNELTADNKFVTVKR